MPLVAGLIVLLPTLYSFLPLCSFPSEGGGRGENSSEHTATNTHSAITDIQNREVGLEVGRQLLADASSLSCSVVPPALALLAPCVFAGALCCCAAFGAERVLFSGFEHKLPRSSIYTVPQSGVDSTTGASLPAVVRVDTTVPFSQLGLDSLDLVELMVALEREFHIELKDEEHDAVKTVEDIINLIHQHPRAQ